MNKQNIVVLGSGMAAFGASHRLWSSGMPHVMYDKHSYYGGHTASHHFAGGWQFDEGPHISFSSEKRIQDLLAENVDGEYFESPAIVNNYWRGYWIKHPAQVNLHGLPADIVISVIRDFVIAQQRSDVKVANYEDWLRASYGDTFAENFPMDYTIKYHTTEARNLNTDWIGPRLYRGSLDEVLRGALQPATADVHYISGFRYPKNGGFAAYLDRFARRAELHLKHEVTGISVKTKEIRFSNGVKTGFSRLISSIPLPLLIPMIDEAPQDVRAAAARLACSEAVVVCLGVNRPDLINTHWTYFYDRDISFARLSTPHMQSPNNVPPGCGSLQAECYFSPKYRPLTHAPEACIEPVIADLTRCGVLRPDDKILFKHAIHIPFANVIFDLETAPALTIVRGWLEDVGIVSCGRYGDWAYIWTDQSFISGENAAQRVIDGRPG